MEDWLLDIETAADLTSENRARFTKAKSQGLIGTLVTEVISSNRSLDEIKDLLRLKLCNADIHTYTSWFMEIQQHEKESLAAYIHEFKTAAKRCNFTNDVTTIRIFVNGLKDTPVSSISTHQMPQYCTLLTQHWANYHLGVDGAHLVYIGMHTLCKAHFCNAQANKEILNTTSGIIIITRWSHLGNSQCSTGKCQISIPN